MFQMKNETNGYLANFNFNPQVPFFNHGRISKINNGDYDWVYYEFKTVNTLYKNSICV